MKRILMVCMTLAVMSNTYAAAPVNWKEATPTAVSVFGEADIQTRQCRLMELDLAALTDYLRRAPAESELLPGLVLEIPMPDGGSARYSVKSVPVVHPDMQKKYPGIYTWAGQGVDDPASVIRLDVTLWGFHAMVISPSGSVFIDPYNRNTTTFYKVYFRSDAVQKSFRAACGYDPSDELNRSNAEDIRRAVQTAGPAAALLRSAGSTLRTYRTAIACTGEYAQFHGNTVPTALSAIVTSLNRVSGVYELEVAIRLTLVPNNDTLVFLNPSTDPYTNNNGGTMLGQNQSTIAARIGNSFYDIGHVFSTGGGGIAGLGVVCNPAQKARGVTGSPSPVGDPFNIDYVAHEMGHQFGGNHTFNSNQGSCVGNGNSSTSFEPGSGTTIMAYAGICAPHNIQNNSDAYFHTASFDEIMDYTTLTTGSICPVSSATGNNPPVISSIGTDHTIPYQTPFLLEGQASDPDGDPVTYCWEEYDLGPSGAPSNPTGNAPLFRSFLPNVSPIRYFPKLAAVVANANSLGEKLPTYARSMQFRLTVRDGKLNGGGVTYEEVLVTLDVVNTGAPFLVTAPNTAVTWIGGTQENVTWDVVGTDVAPISTQNVDIFLSTDGGFTYPVTLATAVPNNGLATVTVPSINTNTARVMVRGAGNVFYDISNANFTITTPQALTEQSFNDAVHFYPNPSAGNFNFSMAGDYRGDLTLTVNDITGKVMVRKYLYKHAAGLFEQFNMEALPAGVYVAELQTEAGFKVEKLVISR